MPIIKAPPDEMDNLYSSEESPNAEAPEMEQEGEAPENETVDQEEAESGTAVIDNKVLSPQGVALKEGDKVILTVVKNYGDESEVKYVPEKAKGTTKPPPGGMDEAEAELDQMNEA